MTPNVSSRLRHIVKCAVFATVATITSLTLACSPGFDLATLNQNSPASEQPSSPHTPDPTPPNDPPQDFQLPRIAWESKSGARTWSLHAFKVVLEKGHSLLEGADDVGDYCPLYFQFSSHERAWFWTSLIAAMAYYESAWTPTARMHETTMVQKEINAFVVECNKLGILFIGMTSTPANETDIFRHEHGSMFDFYFCDATTLKTIIRRIPDWFCLKKEP